MAIRTIIFFGILVCSRLNAQTEIKFLKKNLVEISVDPSNEEYTDLQALKKYIGDSKIVLLGEQSHGDGTVFSTKVRLIKFLHDEMGFDVLAFENSMVDCSMAWEKIQAGLSVRQSCRKYIFPIWSWTAELTPLYTYVDNSLNNSPLIISGFDCQMPMSRGREETIQALEGYLKKKNSSLGDSAERHNFIYNFNSIGLNKSPYDVSVLKDLNYSKFKQTLQRLKEEASKGSEPQDVQWHFFLKSTLDFLQGSVNKSPYLSEFHDKKFNYGTKRDSLMSINLVHLSEKIYPGKKIIVWAASYHITRNHDNTMGSFLEKYWKGKVYTIGFTAALGSNRNIGNGQNINLVAFKPSSFEDLFSQTGTKNFFLDFKTNSQSKKGKWLTDQRVMRPFGYVDVTKDWTKNFDAVIFNKEMSPAHMENQ